MQEKLCCRRIRTSALGKEASSCRQMPTIKLGQQRPTGLGMMKLLPPLGHWRDEAELAACLPF